MTGIDLSLEKDDDESTARRMTAAYTPQEPTIAHKPRSLYFVFS